jgi:hypothetical protein
MFGYAKRKYAIGGAMQPAAPASPEGGLDIEGQVREGVEAFMASQDPVIAVEVVTMLAEMLGVAPEIDPFGQEPQAPMTQTGQVPAGAQGMRFYRKGGKVAKKFGNGGETDDKKSGKKIADSVGNGRPQYNKLNPKTSDEQNAYKVQDNLRKALKFKSDLSVGEKSTKPVYDAKSGSQTSASVPKLWNDEADSTIKASRDWNKEYDLRKKKPVKVK